MNNIDKVLVLALIVSFMGLVILGDSATSALDTQDDGMKFDTNPPQSTAVALVEDEPMRMKSTAGNTSVDEKVEVVPIAPPTPLFLLKEFLKNDTTSEHIYNHSNDYVCIDFAIDLAQNLTAAGYGAGCVAKTAKWHGMTGHMIVWVDLETNNTMYIETELDHVMTPAEFTSTIDMDDYIVREITIQHAERKRIDMRRWR